MFIVQRLLPRRLLASPPMLLSPKVNIAPGLPVVDPCECLLLLPCFLPADIVVCGSSQSTAVTSFFQVNKTATASWQGTGVTVIEIDGGLGMRDGG